MADNNTLSEIYLASSSGGRVRLPAPLSESVAVASDVAPRPQKPVRQETAFVASEAIEEMKYRFKQDDLTGAHWFATKILERSPNNRQAAETLRACEEQLSSLIVGELGGWNACPEIRVSDSSRAWLSVSKEQRAIVELINGARSFREIVEESPCDQLTTLRHLKSALR